MYQQDLLAATRKPVQTQYLCAFQRRIEALKRSWMPAWAAF
jgi:hypothetical protein